MTPRSIALVGDYSVQHTAHRAIPRALELVAAELGADLRWDWIATRDLRDRAAALARYAGLWLVPASPYENPRGALDAVRWAREGGHPFLGTCGGFQHALLELAQNVAGIGDADHAETNPTGSSLVVSRLACSLVEQSGRVMLTPGSALASAYGSTSARAEYHCNFGLNAEYRERLERTGLRFTAEDESGEPRGAELPGHPFFCGVLFQPERAALRGEVPPLVRAFVRAVAAVP